MSIVVDASAILAVLLNENKKDEIVKKTKGCNFIAPPCLDFEIGNALSALCKRNAISVSDAVLVWHEFAKIPRRYIPVDFPKAIYLAGIEKIYAYDAYYLHCAETMRLPLLTLDIKMKEVAIHRGISIMEV